MVIKKGDFVSLDYEGRLETGEIFDSSTHGDHSHPLSFQVGSGQVIPGFDAAVTGMEKGEEKEFTIESNQAYGEYRSELKREVPRTALPKDQEPKEGMMLMIGNQQGQQFPARITKVTPDSIEIDLNHPLAGKKLIFKIKILEISNKPIAHEDPHTHYPDHSNHDHSHESEDEMEKVEKKPSKKSKK